MMTLKDVSALTGGATMTEAYKVVPAFSVAYADGAWVQRPTTGPDFLCMTFDEAMHSLRVQGNAFVAGDVCLAVRRALGVVPDAQEVTP